MGVGRRLHRTGTHDAPRPVAVGRRWSDCGQSDSEFSTSVKVLDGRITAVAFSSDGRK